MELTKRLSCVVLLGMLSACASQHSTQTAATELHAASISLGDNPAQITFSADKQYETESGSVRWGRPFICDNGTVSQVAQNPSSGVASFQSVGGKMVAVTSVIKWSNTGFIATCGPFVAFVPEDGQRYAVVNELVGGKGFRALWTGMARQTCEVSVYKLTGASFSKVETQAPPWPGCKAPD